MTHEPPPVRRYHPVDLEESVSDLSESLYASIPFVDDLDEHDYDPSPDFQDLQVAVNSLPLQEIVVTQRGEDVGVVSPSVSPSQNKHAVVDEGPPPAYREHPYTQNNEVFVGPQMGPWIQPPRTPWPRMVVGQEERPIIITPSVTLGGQDRYTMGQNRNIMTNNMYPYEDGVLVCDRVFQDMQGQRKGIQADNREPLEQRPQQMYGGYQYHDDRPETSLGPGVSAPLRTGPDEHWRQREPGMEYPVDRKMLHYRDRDETRDERGRQRDSMEGGRKPRDREPSRREHPGGGGSGGGSSGGSSNGDRDPAKANSGNEHHRRIKPKKPALYNGKTSWLDYLVHFEMIAEINRWDQDEMALELATSLRDSALSVLSDIDVYDQRNYDVLVRALTNRFEPPNYAEVYKAELKSKVRQKGESLCVLVQDIKRLIRKIYVGDPR
ncbi:MAG: hypothetical protein GY702_19640, partial [Desulfobulbaceae bacterium]|nr:hypothetical protein [Desulfobulbaceae bacterium]